MGTLQGWTRVLPQVACTLNAPTDQSAGADLRYPGKTRTLAPGQQALLALGLGVAVLEGTYGRIAPSLGLAPRSLQVLGEEWMLPIGWKSRFC
uniref:dUTPase-like domain-containing protein n=1 Tax=Pelusios castaneus TaxID=367368 RepID=A0A8C8SWF0_9SAUR